MTRVKDISETELIQKCRKGNKKYQEVLYKRFYGYAMGISLRYLSDRDDALEVVNDAFIKIFHSINQFRSGEVLKPWIRRIVVNTAIDRKRKDLKYMHQIDIDEAYELGIEASVISTMGVQDILNLFECLNPLQRSIFNLYEIDGYKHEEIAAILDIPIGTSRANLSRAKEKLRMACLQENINSR